MELIIGAMVILSLGYYGGKHDSSEIEKELNGCKLALKGEGKYITVHEAFNAVMEKK